MPRDNNEYLNQSCDILVENIIPYSNWITEIVRKGRKLKKNNKE